MTNSLQRIAESLAERLGRSAAIDDARLRLLAHSSHQGKVDRVRAESVLRRAVPKVVAEHVYACRDGATGLFFVTPREDLGLDDGRIGHPIIHQGALLGFVWLLTSEGPVEGEHHNAARGAASDAALIMHRDYLQAGLDRDREHALIKQLFDDADAQRSAAAAEIIEERLFGAGSYAVLVAEIDLPGGHATDGHQLALASGLAAVRSRRAPQSVLTFERRNQAILITAEPLGPSARDELIALGGSLRDAVAAASDADECWVGIGRSRSDLAEVTSSYDEALRTIRICRRVRTLDPVTPVERLGVYELLGQVPESTLRSMLHPGLRVLMEQGSRADSLIQTLETFLDSAGDVKTASERLFAHRTSLYYRLRRIQELTGLDLSNGDDRLIAHLGLKIARLIDLETPDR
ncbi:PucR family transcriptional regulator [Streptomyces sp. NPDC059092]|uniref:PucR family transcriptional regulator n=1 Tax=Streptomyces sp. NPDC059092 TaxID=3346725 RepID=UPI0036D0491A